MYLQQHPRSNSLSPLRSRSAIFGYSSWSRMPPLMKFHLPMVSISSSYKVGYNPTMGKGTGRKPSAVQSEDAGGCFP